MIFASTRALRPASLIMIGLSFIMLFGAGCRREPPKISYVQDQAAKTDNVTVSSGDSDNITISDVEPQELAILLLTPNTQATVTRGEEQTDAVHQMQILAGDEIEVIKGEVQLLYPDYGVSILSEGTNLIVLPAQGADDKGLSAQIILEAGKIWTRLEKVLGTDESFSVESSDVVATVRGTAFGVSIVNGELDIKVADSQVAVTTREAMKGAVDLVKKAVYVSAGNAIKVNPKLLSAGENPRNVLLQNLRKVSETEKKDIFYRFGTQKIDPVNLKKPDMVFKWSAPIFLNDKTRERLTPAQIERLEEIRKNQLKIRPELLDDELRIKQLLINSVRFQKPLIEVVLLEMTTTDTPSAIGPSN